MTESDNPPKRDAEATPEPGFAERGFARLLRAPWSASRAWTLPVCVALLVVVGAVDSLLASNLSFWGLYLAPVGCAAWLEGSRAGYGMALVAAMGVVLIEIAAGTEVMGRGVMAWNVIQSLVAFSACA